MTSARKDVKAIFVSLLALTVVVFLTLASCWTRPKEEIWRGRTTLDTTHFAIVAPRPLVMMGPTTEVCISPVAISYRVVADSINVAGSVGARPNVAIIDTNGVMDTISSWSSPVIGHPTPRRLPAGLNRENDNLVCMFEHHSGKVHVPISRVEIWSDHPLPITRVLWWSGRRAAFF